MPSTGNATLFQKCWVLRKPASQNQWNPVLVLSELIPPPILSPWVPAVGQSQSWVKQMNSEPKKTWLSKRLGDRPSYNHTNECKFKLQKDHESDSNMNWGRFSMEMTIDLRVKKKKKNRFWGKMRVRGWRQWKAEVRMSLLTIPIRHHSVSPV